MRAELRQRRLADGDPSRGAQDLNERRIGACSERLPACAVRRRKAGHVQVVLDSKGDSEQRALIAGIDRLLRTCGLLESVVGPNGGERVQTWVHHGDALEA